MSPGLDFEIAPSKRRREITTSNTPAPPTAGRILMIADALLPLAIEIVVARKTGLLCGANETIDEGPNAADRRIR